MELTQNESLNKKELTNKKLSLTERLKELQVEISGLQLTKNRVYFKSGTIPDDKLAKRKRLVQEYNELQREVISINTFLQPFKQRSFHFEEIIKESLPKDFVKEVIEESIRRDDGEKPLQIKYFYDLHEIDKYKLTVTQLKKTISEYHKIIVNSRIALTDFIDKNTDQNNKGDILIKVSQMNKTLPTLNELEIKKRVNLF